MTWAAFTILQEPGEVRRCRAALPGGAGGKGGGAGGEAPAHPRQHQQPWRVLHENQKTFWSRNNFSTRVWGVVPLRIRQKEAAVPLGGAIMYDPGIRDVFFALLPVLMLHFVSYCV